jgi:urea transporter
MNYIATLQIIFIFKTWFPVFSNAFCFTNAINLLFLPLFIEEVNGTNAKNIVDLFALHLGFELTFLEGYELLVDFTLVRA